MEYYDAGNGNTLQEEFNRTTAAALPDFNPRVSPSGGYSIMPMQAADTSRWPLNAPFPDPILGSDGDNHKASSCNRNSFAVGVQAVAESTPNLSASPGSKAAGCSPSSRLYAADAAFTKARFLRPDPRPSVMSKEPPLQFPTGVHSGLNKNNPYLDAQRSPSWWHMHQAGLAGYFNTHEEWSYSHAGTFPSVPGYHHSAHGFEPERGVLHPVFCNTDHLPAYQHVLQQQQPPPPGTTADQTPRSTHNLQYTANPPNVSGSFGPVLQNCSMDGGGSFKLGVEDRYAWGTDQVRLVGKSQSMRALYEENAALRRALFSMRRGALDHLQGEQVVAGERDRYIASDAAEGRALSMRERGKWGMQAGEVLGAAGGGCNHNCSVWAAMQGQQLAAGAAQSMQTRASYRRRHHNHDEWWEGTAAHPLFYGGSAGGWPEEICGGRDRADYTWPADHPPLPSRDGVYEEGGGAADQASGEGVSLKQLLVETERASANGEKWRRHGKKKASRHRAQAHASTDSGSSSAAGLDESHCAMCGGKLRQVEAPMPSAAKKLGLPLRLCPACHPRAAASLPPSTTKSPPLSSTHARHRVATAIFMACKPTSTTTSLNPSSKKKPKSRIVDLCRHFVGLH